MTPIGRAYLGVQHVPVLSYRVDFVTRIEMRMLRGDGEVQRRGSIF